MSIKNVSNLRTIAYHTGTIEIAWDSQTLSASEIFIIQGVSNGIWGELDSTRQDTALLAPPSNISALRVLVRDTSTGSLSEPSNVLAINLSNASDVHLKALIGKDESGQSRFLATTPEGVVKVTGATVTNYGGDASAANQNTQITQLNTVSASLNTALSKLSNILSKLNDVIINPAVVTDMKNVAVTNLPSNYPDMALLNTVNAMSADVAKATDIAAVIAELSNKLTPSDLSFALNGSLNTNVNNLPSDFPDNALLASIASDIAPALNSLITNTAQLENILTGLHTNNSSIATDAGSINNTVILLQQIANSLLTACEATKANSEEVALVNNAISDQVTDFYALANKFLKAENLDIDLDKNLAVKVNNLPSNYPDAAAIAELSQIKNNLINLNQGVSANISGPLPAGDNVIGQVSIASLLLPENAATEGSLVSLNSSAGIIRQETQRIKSALISIDNELKALALSVSLLTPVRKFILEETMEVNASGASGTFRILDFYTQLNKSVSDLNAYKNYEFAFISYGQACDVSIYYEDSHNGLVFRHKIADIKLGLADIKNFKYSLPIQNISMTYSSIFGGAGTNNGNANVIKIAVYGNN